MASTTDIGGIVYPGPFARDDALGYAEVNNIIDGVGTLANVIQYEMDSAGHAESRKWVRANAIYYVSGSNYVLQAQSQELVFPATIAWTVDGVIDIVYDVAITDSTYEVYFQCLGDGASPSPLVAIPSGDATYKTTTGLRVSVWSVGTTPALTNPYAFNIALVYGV